MNRLIQWIRQVIGRMFTVGGVKDAVKGSVAVTDEMTNSIQLWLRMYRNQAPWLRTPAAHSLNLPAFIARELAQLVTLEMEVKLTGSPRADYLSAQLRPLLANIRRYVEYACAGGGLVFKPYPNQALNAIEIDFVQADSFLPVAFNSRGEVTDAYFVETKVEGRTYYRRLERHTLQGERYLVENRAYESSGRDTLGGEIPLAKVPEWKDLQPQTVVRTMGRPLFSYFRMPMANNVDPSSPLGVSVYANAVGLIQDADEQYARLLWEYEGGELAVDISETALRKDLDTGETLVPGGRERLFRKNALDPDKGAAESLKTFAPQLRDASLLNGLEEIKRQIEDKVGLARGSISSQTVEAKTATEIRMTRQRSYVTVTDIQMALEGALRTLLDAMDCYASLYRFAPPGAYEAAFTWDDSVVTDAEAERLRDKDDVSMGILQPWEYRMKWYREDEATARAMTSPRTDADGAGMFGGA